MATKNHKRATMEKRKNNYCSGVAMAAVMLVMAASCLWEGTVFYHYHTLPSDGWDRQDTLVYELPELVPNANYGIAVNVRYTTDYPYQGLGVVVRHNLTDSATWKCDTLLCTLFDKQGLPTGHGTTDFYQVEVKTKTDGKPLRVTTGTTGQESPIVQLLHCMTDDKVVGVRDVGIRVNNE